VTTIVSQFLDCKTQGGAMAHCGCFCKDIVYSSIHAKPVDNKTDSGAVTKSCYVAHFGLLFSFYTSIIANGPFWVNHKKTLQNEGFLAG
jgi:hypothetical protein